MARKSSAEIAKQRYGTPVVRSKGSTQFPGRNYSALHPTTDGKPSNVTTFPQTKRALPGGI